MDEGPFGEYTGYRAGDRAPRPVCHVTAITHRNDPILPVSCMGVPVDDWAALRPVHMAALLQDLRDRGFTVNGLYSPPEGATNLLFVSTKVLYPYYPQTLASAILSAQQAGKEHEANFLLAVALVVGFVAVFLTEYLSQKHTATTTRLP